MARASWHSPERGSHFPRGRCGKRSLKGEVGGEVADLPPNPHNSPVLESQRAAAKIELHRSSSRKDLDSVERPIQVGPGSNTLTPVFRLIRSGRSSRRQINLRLTTTAAFARRYRRKLRRMNTIPCRFKTNNCDSSCLSPTQDTVPGDMALRGAPSLVPTSGIDTSLSRAGLPDRTLKVDLAL